MVLCAVLATALFAGLDARGETFRRHPKRFQVGPKPSAILAADLDGDGVPEILTANTGTLTDPRKERPANDEVSLLRATDALEYAAEPPLRTDFAPYALGAAHIGGSKDLDVLVACFMSIHHADLCLFRNVGEHLFESSSFPVPEETLPYKRMLTGEREPVFTRPGLTSLALGDFNGDGLRDVIATGWSSDLLVYFPGAPAKYFGDPKFTPAGEGPRDVKAADFSGSGKLDLAVALYHSNEIGVWKGQGDGAFDPITRFSSRGRLPSKLQIADVNRDDKLDIVVSHCYTDDSIVIFYGEGQYTFSTSQEIMLGKDRNVLEHEIRDLVVADLNEDKRLDIAVACQGSGQVVVLVNASTDDAIPQAFQHEVYPFEQGKPRALCAADLNKDGATDLAVALVDVNEVAFLIGTPPKIEPAAKPAGKPARKPTSKR